MISKIKRKGYKPETYEMPNLLIVQLESFKEFLAEDLEPEQRGKRSLHGVFRESFPIEDVHKRYILEYIDYEVGKPKFTVKEAIEKSLTYSVPLWANLRLLKKDEETGEFKEQITQKVYMCEVPYMTERGTFIINGVERVIVSQLHRSPGVYLTIDTKGIPAYKALLVPYRGPWVEFTIDGSKNFTVTVSKRRKIPITRLIRVLGKLDDKGNLRDVSMSEVLKKLIDYREIGLEEVARLREEKLEDNKPRYIVLDDIIDKNTGVVEKEAPFELVEITPERLKELGYEKIAVGDLKEESCDIIYSTYKQDRIKDEDGAIGNVYRTLRYTPPPEDRKEAVEYIKSVFFDPKRFLLGEVGRFKINMRLGLNIEPEVDTLTEDDLIAIVKHLIDFYRGKEKEDDLEDLSNRRVRRVGELLYEQFKIAFTRLTRVVRERMLLDRDQNLTPKKLVNPRLVTSSLVAYFTSERLSQFLDQNNPLSELTHKRRLSALGKGGLTRETAGFEVRDVHPSHFGRLCPIETPEGQNIGLITSLTTYAKIDRYGFIITPLRRVRNGVVIWDEVLEMTAQEERDYKIAPADTPVDPKTGKILVEDVWVRYQGQYPLVKAEEVDFIDVSPRQLVSPSASLIPFLAHDDANRALMGCNMQRQAVPLLEPEPPIVGTGMETKIAYDSGAVVVARNSGIVKEVDATRIVIEPKTRKRKHFLEEGVDIYELTTFKKSNQNTVIHQRPIVRPGQEVKKGEVIADSSSTHMGELSLGKNLLVAFLPWYGYNFEDAIILSEDLLKKDTFTSIHILEFEVEVRETKLGPEEVTRDLPNVPQEALKNLDVNGIVRIGTHVKPDDILVGKVSPKGEKELSPEERLIYAIFSEQAKEVRDTSKRVPPSVEGVVVDVVVLSRKKDDPLSLRMMRERKKRAEESADTFRRTLKSRLKDVLAKLLDGEEAQSDITGRANKVIFRKGEIIKGEELYKHDPLRLHFGERIVKDDEKEEKIRFYMEEARKVDRQIKEKLDYELQEIERGDELPLGVRQLIKVYVAQKRKLQVGDKLSGRHGNKGIVAKIAPVEDMPFLDDGTPVDIVLNPLGVPSRMNVGQILETILGWAGKEKGIYYAVPVFEGFTIEDVQKELKKAGLPESGKTRLRDGKTGEYFDSEVTVGYMYMMKLIHMVEDKVHARAIGPYSLITQQPVGGKAHFGGQRFGEMEVWALEGYGAAYTLQEMLTYKSDDEKGRNKLYQALIKGEEPPEPGIPASFEVLIKHLKGLGLDVIIETEG